MPSRRSANHWERLAWSLVVVALPAAGAASEAETRSDDPIGADGAQVYEKVCAYCHETDIGPALLHRNLPAVYINYMVRNGMRAMPAFRTAEIDDRSLEKLVDFVATSSDDQ